MAADMAPGKAVEAQIGEESDRVVYWVQVVDSKNTTRTIYVDAETGKGEYGKGLSLMKRPRRGKYEKPYFRCDSFSGSASIAWAGFMIALLKRDF